MDDYGSRYGAFDTGRGVGLTPGLEESAEVQNSAAPHMFTPTSVLHQFIASPNGMSARDSDRRLLGGGLLPTQNGFSQQSSDASRMITSKYMNV